MPHEPRKAENLVQVRFKRRDSENKAQDLYIVGWELVLSFL